MLGIESVPRVFCATTDITESRVMPVWSCLTRLSSHAERRESAATAPRRRGRDERRTTQGFMRTSRGKRKEGRTAGSGTRKRERMKEPTVSPAIRIARRASSGERRGKPNTPRRREKRLAGIPRPRRKGPGLFDRTQSVQLVLLERSVRQRDVGVHWRR